MQEALEKDFDLPSDIVDMSRVGKPVVQEPKAIEAQVGTDGLSPEEKAQSVAAENARVKKPAREPGED